VISKVNLLLPVKNDVIKAAGNASNEYNGQDFAAFFSQALNNVNTLQTEANKASTKLATGQIDDIAPVVIATEKASIALQLTVQVRNKVVDAYNEVMRMQV
jgi:flagellar hook-basal body complex protein FliE